MLERLLLDFAAGEKGRDKLTNRPAEDNRVLGAGQAAGAPSEKKSPRVRENAGAFF
jgi:hypothetical protein